MKLMNEKPQILQLRNNSPIKYLKYLRQSYFKLSNKFGLLLIQNSNWGNFNKTKPK